MGLDGVAIVMDTEKYFGITITDQEAESCHTVGEMISVVLTKADRSKWTDTQIKNNVRRIVGQNLGVRLKDVRPESKFVDLGLI